MCSSLESPWVRDREMEIISLFGTTRRDHARKKDETGESGIDHLDVWQPRLSHSLEHEVFHPCHSAATHDDQIRSHRRHFGRGLLDPRLDLVLLARVAQLFDLDPRHGRTDESITPCRAEERRDALLEERFEAFARRYDAELPTAHEGLRDAALEHADAELGRRWTEVFADHVLQRMIGDCFRTTKDMSSTLGTRGASTYSNRRGTRRTCQKLAF